MDSRIRQLLSSCEQGDLQTVQSLLEQGLSVDICGDDDVTPLQVACANGHEQVVRLLLMRGAGLDTTNRMGWTPLMQAARYGHMSVTALLLQNKADVNAKNRLNASALTVAAGGGHIQTVRLLLEAGIDLNSSGTTSEFTPILAAAQHGHDAVLRLLLDRSGDVNYRTSSAALSPLMIAALNGHMTTAQILIERGADANAVSVDGKTALEMASLRGKREVKGYLDRKTTNKPKIAPEDIKPDVIEAAKHSNIQRIREILSQDISQRDACSPQDGATPLMFAAMTGRMDIAQLLVDRCCDMNKQDVISGWTALMQAIYHGKKNVAMLLINCGADVTIQAKNGCTAFDMASLIEDVDTELLRLLAAKTMHVNKVEKTRPKWSGRNGGSSGPISPDHSDDHPKTGLKAWWSRMSNRFRNLKLGRTFNLSSNRLAPMALEVDATDPDATIKSNGSAKERKVQKRHHQSGKNDSIHDVMSMSGMLPILQTSERTNAPQRTSRSLLNLNTIGTTSSITSYETMLLETKKSAAMYTLEINPPHSNMMGTETLKPVVPPFLPQPTFDLDNNERSKMPLSARRDFLDRNAMTLNRPIKFLQTRSSVSTIGSTPVTPLTSHRYLYGNVSPGSSGGASGVQLVNKSTPDLTSDPLFVVGPQITPYTSRLFMSRTRTTGSAFKAKSDTTSPNSSTSGSSSITPQRNSQGRSTSSKESTTSTLTPSPSPVPKSGDKMESADQRTTSESHDDDLSDILKKLSLEKYNPIFEEQEVDMEAFLTLTDSDLKELGIAQGDSRRQILTAITELNSGKGRERQHFHDTMTSFQSTLTSKLPLEPGSEGHSQLILALNAEREQTDSSLMPSAKSRSS